MANNKLLASDNFASGSLAAGWSTITSQSASIVTGTPKVAECSALSTSCGQQWTGLSFPPDQTSEITIGANWANELNTYVYPYVRLQSGSYSGYAALLFNGTLHINRYDNGVQASPLLSQTVTIAAGDVWTFQAAGSVLSIYRNGQRIGYIQDSTYPTGAPGFGQYTSVNVAHSPVAAWRGYNMVQQDGVWTKQGIALGITSASPTPIKGINTGTVLYESNAQILLLAVPERWEADGRRPAESALLKLFPRDWSSLHLFLPFRSLTIWFSDSTGSGRCHDVHFRRARIHGVRSHGAC